MMLSFLAKLQAFIRQGLSRPSFASSSSSNPSAVNHGSVMALAFLPSLGAPLDTNMWSNICWSTYNASPEPDQFDHNYCLDEMQLIKEAEAPQHEFIAFTIFDLNTLEPRISGFRLERTVDAAHKGNHRTSLTSQPAEKLNNARERKRTQGDSLGKSYFFSSNTSQ